VGKTRDVVAALKALERVKAVDPVTGPYDAIAVLEADELTAINRLVEADIQRIPGVIRTVTCLSV
jgi:DNA-binding Lrp family transcriptional regulator